jgi:hypothetical protein
MDDMVASILQKAEQWVVMITCLSPNLADYRIESRVEVDQLRLPPGLGRLEPASRRNQAVPHSPVAA